MIDISELVSTKGKSLELEQELDLSEISVSGTTYKVAPQKPFHLCLKNDEGKQVLVSGSTEVEVIFPCDRCLSDTPQAFELEVDRSLLIQEGGVLASDDPDEELTFIADRQLDYIQLLYDEILVNWPTKVLCQEQCKGICHVCGANLNARDCGCDRQVIDPRMAKFSDIFDQFKEV